MQARTVCAKGPVKAVRKETAQGSVARCGSKTALGYMNLVSVKQSAAVSPTPRAAPDGARRGWLRVLEQRRGLRAQEGIQEGPVRDQKHVVHAGNRTATIVAKCPSGSRALAWGFIAADAGQRVVGQRFDPVAVCRISGPREIEVDADVSRLPICKGAKEQAQVSATAVCGQPRSR